MRQPTSSSSDAEEEFEATWKKRFQSFAMERDDDAGIAGWSQGGLDARLRNFVRAWHPSASGARWLDAGCGAGTYSRLLSELEAQVLAIDYSKPSVLKAKDRTTHPVAWCVADVRKLPIRPSSLNGILCFGVLQALSESRTTMRELATVLAPEGELWIDALNKWSVPHLWDQARRMLLGKPCHLRYESPSSLKKLMKDNGFEHIRLTWLPILPQQWQRYQAWMEGPWALWIIERLPLIPALFSHAIVAVGKLTERNND
jgi:ubiquinone/menaquinone biosynthesis C-methylase UbiE